MIQDFLEEIIWALPINRDKWRLLNFFHLGVPRRVIIAEINDNYLRLFGRLPDLEKPITWTEKLQWLKLNHKNPLMLVAADKYRVREYVKNRGLEKILTKSIGVYRTAAEIDFSALPKQFVLKVNHDSGGVIVVQDKNAIEEAQVRKQLKRFMRKPYIAGVIQGEWHYLHIPRRIIVEQYLGEMLETASEYRLHCMNGVVKFISVGAIINGQRVSCLFDETWQPIDASLQYSRFDQQIAKPKMLTDMLDIARNLAEDFVYVRVDLYQLDDRIHFGELTFFPGAGYAVLEPIEWDHTFGSWLKLPEAD